MAAQAPPLWSPTKKKLVTALVALHLFAIFISPMAGPPPASDLSRWCASWVSPYLEALFLGHGYRFFAPNPGPSHLVRYEILGPDGAVIETHRFPSTTEQSPRLFYHRHFMVAERVNELVSLPEPEELLEDFKLRRELIEQLKQEGKNDIAREVEAAMEDENQMLADRRKLRDELLEGIAQYWMRYHNADRIRIYSVRHPLPTPLDVRAGAKLDDPDSYLERLVYEWPRPEPVDASTLEEITP